MRLRTGDWRVLFTTDGNTITIHAVGHHRSGDDRFTAGGQADRAPGRSARVDARTRAAHRRDIYD